MRKSDFFKILKLTLLALVFLYLYSLSKFNFNFNKIDLISIVKLFLVFDCDHAFFISLISFAISSTFCSLKIYFLRK